MNKPLFTGKWLLLLIPVLFSVLLNAAEAPKTPPKDEGTHQETADNDRAKDPKKNEKNAEEPSIFKPTEELSEDHSVPFPTDI